VDAAWLERAASRLAIDRMCREQRIVDIGDTAALPRGDR